MFLWSPKVHYRSHKWFLLVLVLNQMNPVDAFKIRFNIILPPMPESHTMSFFDQNSVYVFLSFLNANRNK